jgi:hypothetical protein
VLDPTGVSFVPMTEEDNQGFGDDMVDTISDRLLQQDITARSTASVQTAGMCSVKGVTPSIAGSLWATAADFYAASPWKRMPVDVGYCLRNDKTGEIKFYTIFGGVNPGIAMLNSWEDFSYLEKSQAPPVSQSLLYMNVKYVSFRDLDDMERFGWRIAKEDDAESSAATKIIKKKKKKKQSKNGKKDADSAEGDDDADDNDDADDDADDEDEDVLVEKETGSYPVLSIVEGESKARRPNVKECFWFEAGMRALLLFLVDLLQIRPRRKSKPTESASNTPFR